ncbi:exodeoxyribonuclease VII large subunit, partial [Bacillus subtilis]|uniref:exodeoxyribonuclease VII large subunit n=1 Tax=Bacillus subtilis TaxID=1423 RepID=UPI00207864B2
MSLKEEKGRMEWVMLGREREGVGFKGEKGMKVVVRGGICVYEGRGKYELYVKEMEVEGVGGV